MRLISLKAKGVYGYLNFSSAFKRNLTFLVGINGAGKTTALRLIMAILTPSLKDLDRIPHRSVELKILLDKRRVTISSENTGESTQIRISGIEQILDIPRLDPRLFQDRARPEERVEEHYTILEEKTSTHPVMQFLRELDTPIFLGLERRNIQGTSPVDPRELYERERILRSVPRKMLVSGLLASGLNDIQYMLQGHYRKIVEAQDRFGAELRTEILLSAFDYTPASNMLSNMNDLPRQKEQISKQIKEKREQIELALRNIRVDKEKFDPVIKRFFDRVDRLSMPRVKKKGKSSSIAIDEIDELFELALNRPLIDRVIKLTKLFDDYTAKLEKLWASTRLFLELANRFLIDTHKQLFIDPVGKLAVKLEDGEERGIDALASGERQIVVMLGFLSINRELDKEGVFIVDEPELSLHMKWQEIFVDSILEAGTKQQFILATHSPAIVLERTENCVYVGE